MSDRVYSWPGNGPTEFNGDVNVDLGNLGVKGDVLLDDGGTFTTTLQTVTATANRVVSIPDVTGTVALIAGSSLQLTYNNAGAQAGVGDGTIIGSGPRFTLPFGYGTGSGGAVTQATNRTTGVTLDKTNGAITLISAAGTTTWQSFTVTNSTVAATDVVMACQKSGTDLYMVEVTNVAAGSFKISYATTGGTTTEQPVFNFAVIKAVIA